MERAVDRGRFPLPFLLAAVLAASCASKKDFAGEYRARLATTHDLLDAGDARAAHGELVRLVADMEAPATRADAVQRALADALFVGIHASAGDRAPFLTEPSRFEFSLDAGLDPNAAAERAPSSTAHRVAAIFHAWRLIADTPAKGDVSLAPESLARFVDVKFARSYGWLVVAASFDELGFTEKAKRIVEQLDHPQHGAVFTSEERWADVALCAALDDYGLSRPVQNRLTRLAFELQRARFEASGRQTDPTPAYRLGCLAAFGRLRPRVGTDFKEHDGEVLDAAWQETFHAWLQDIAATTGTFRSSSQTEIQRGVVACDLSGEPAIDFTWSRVR